MKTEKRWTTICLVAGLAIAANLGAASSVAAQDEEELAKQLANPIASLISLPFQLDLDQRIGPGDDGHRLLLDIRR